MSFVTTSERHFDSAVIGGGLVGAATAYGLAGLGLKTAMLDEGDIAFRAARGNSGLVWVQGKGAGLPAYAAWTVQAARAWPEFAAELMDATGTDVKYRKTGGLKYCLSDREFDDRGALISRIEIADRHARTEMLDRGALAEIYPGLGPDVVGASYNPMDGQVDPLSLLRALHAGFQNRGGHYLPHHAVDAIRPGNGDFVLSVGGDEIQAGKILLAAGIANARLAEMAGLYGGVKPIRGQILVSERLKPCLPVPATDLIQSDTGGLLIGNIEEDAGTDDSTHFEALRGMARRAVATFPFLEAVRIIRAWGALRVMTGDGCPVYHQSENHPGAFGISTHSGVTLSSLHASKVARWIAGKDRFSELASFHPARFHVH